MNKASMPDRAREVSAEEGSMKIYVINTPNKKKEVVMVKGRSGRRGAAGRGGRGSCGGKRKFDGRGPRRKAK